MPVTIIKPKGIYKGYFNYYQGSILKTTTFEQKTGKWVLEFEKHLQQNINFNYVGKIVTIDISTQQVSPQQRLKGLLSQRINHGAAFTKFIHNIF